MTFRELRQHVRDNCLLSTDFFAETLRFAPRGLRERTLTGHVAKRSRVGTNQTTVDQVDTIEVLVSRDETGTLGGIAKIAHGDCLYRSTDYLGLPYVFEGEIVSETPDHWRLVFSRKVRRTQGRGIA